MERQVDFLETKTRELDILADEIIASAKVTAHSVGMMVNTLLGKPALQLAALAV